MEKLSPAIPEIYGISIRSSKKEKGYFLADTGQDFVKIHISQEPIESIRLQHCIKEHLAAAGFTQTDRYKTSKLNQPYAVIGRDRYVMTAHPHKPKELDLEDEGAVLKAFETLALFHLAAKHIPCENIATSPPLFEIYTRQLYELSQAGKQARKGPRLSDFDVAFIKHAQKITETMQSAIECLKKTSYTELYNNAVNQNTLCHNALKEENLPASGGHTYIVNFAKASIDLQLNDLAALIRRYAQRSSKSISVDRLVKTYAAINPLPHDAAEILHTQLIFPWAFMKLVGQYYSKKRNWTPNGLISRMDSIIADRDSYEKYIATMGVPQAY